MSAQTMTIVSRNCFKGHEDIIDAILTVSGNLEQRMEAFTHGSGRVRHTCDDVEILFEGEREIGEESSKRVDRHECERDADDSLIFIDLIVLWAFSTIQMYE